ncbi:MAG: acyltransferase [Nitrospinota bacterium]|nr:acyltransferase [Nitrospinota bacterium]
MEIFQGIAPDVELGQDVKIYNFVNAYGCKIGDRTKVGTFVEIQKGAVIGSDCKISSHSFICEGVTIGNRVFIGHNVTFINDKYPAATNRDGTMKTDADWTVIPIVVGDKASIGSSVTILCGVTIGAQAVIGAGSVVTQSVPPGQVWAGNPARFMKNNNPKNRDAT